MTETCYPAVGEELIKNPNYVPATPGYYVETENLDYVPATDGYWAEEANPEYVEAQPEQTVFEGVVKYTWNGGPRNELPSSPYGTDAEHWNNVGLTNDSKSDHLDTVIQQGNGKASFFYYEESYTVTPATPAQGEEFIDVWVEGTPAVGEPIIKTWIEEVPAEGSEFIENPDYVAGYCKTVEPVKTPVQEAETVTITTPTTKTFETSTTTTPQEAPQLAVTGGADALTGLLLGTVLLGAGIAMIFKRKVN